MGKVIGGIFKGSGIILKLAFVGILLVGNFILNCVGVLICAITSNN